MLRSLKPRNLSSNETQTEEKKISSVYAKILTTISRTNDGLISQLCHTTALSGSWSLSVLFFPSNLFSL
jgi:hypothetical protein